MDDQDINYMNGLACPACGQSVALEIESSALVRITQETLEVMDDVFHLFDGSPTRCFDCGFIADFEQFRVDYVPDPPMPLPEGDVPKPTLH
jgi:DNA-directed RNA polymerase subunit N (RpoN/RPB10)